MPKFKGLIAGLLRYKGLLYELVIRDIKVRYRRSFLGLLWTLLNPILMMAVMTLVFSNLFQIDIKNFPIYFFSGNLLFSFVTESTINGLHSITGNASLIKKVYIPKYLFPVSKVLSSAVNLSFSLIAMMLVMIVTGAKFYATLILTPVIVLFIVMFAVGLAMMLSTVMVFFRDTAHLYGVITLAWMYLTPVFYPESLLQDKAAWLLTTNPMVQYIRYFREIVLYGTVPSLEQHLICLSISFVILALGMLFFYRKQDRFILYI